MLRLPSRTDWNMLFDEAYLGAVEEMGEIAAGFGGIVRKGRWASFAVGSKEVHRGGRARQGSLLWPDGPGARASATVGLHNGARTTATDLGLPATDRARACEKGTSFHLRFWRGGGRHLGESEQEAKTFPATTSPRSGLVHGRGPPHAATMSEPRSESCLLVLVSFERRRLATGCVLSDGRLVQRFRHVVHPCGC